MKPTKKKKIKTIVQVVSDLVSKLIGEKKSNKKAA